MQGLNESEGIHRRIVSEIERAREVVTYGLDIGRSEGAAGEQIARESVENAKSLVGFQRKKTRPVRRLAEPSLVEALAAAFSQCYGGVEEGRFGLLSRLARQRAPAHRGVSGQAQRPYSPRARRACCGSWSRQAYRRMLVQVGLERGPGRRLEHVKRRAALEVDDRSEVYQQLPMIYRRLFRLEPVQDPRFLVGREAEMAALLEARDQVGRAASRFRCSWSASAAAARPACSTARRCGSSRMYSRSAHPSASAFSMPTSIDAFLRQALGLPEDADLAEALQQRAPRDPARGGRADLSARAWTASRAYGGCCLWSPIAAARRCGYLCLNQLAFKFLDPAVGMQPVFSHRINAMSVEPDHLVNAILLRHNLSGLRLRFAPPPSRHPLIERLRRPLGLDRQRARSFFRHSL